ncbi:hypothetical protein [Salinibacillus aidingensis]
MNKLKLTGGLSLISICCIRCYYTNFIQNNMDKKQMNTTRAM